MKRLRTSRNREIDLLSRPPLGTEHQQGWAALIVDPVEQLEELADLHGRGLLSRDEFERHKARILGGVR